jgi:hypothetical protein
MSDRTMKNQGSEKEGTAAAGGRYFGAGSSAGLPFSDPSVPNVARIYDFLLGGKNNFAADREAAGKLTRLIPDGVPATYQNRRSYSA